MSANFNATFSPTKKTLPEIVTVADEILRDTGFSFQNHVWRYRRVGNQPQLGSIHPVEVPSAVDALGIIERWWGFSMSYFSRREGEVYLRCFSAGDAGRHVVYNESRAIERQREGDSTLHGALLGLQLQILDAIDSNVCTYAEESPEGFKPASLQDLEDAIRLRGRWPGDIVIVSATSVSPEIEAQLADLSRFIKRSTTGALIVDYLGNRP
jgi:hypothetical protein